MKRSLIAVMVAVAVVPAFAIEPYKVIDSGKRPESVCRGFGDGLYVTVMGEADVEGDGKVCRIEGEKVVDFAKGMDEPKGIALVGGVLVVADMKRVWRVDASGKAEVLAAAGAFPHPPAFLNDVAAAPDGKSVYVTDMGDNGAMFGPDGMWEVNSPEAGKIRRIARVYRVGLDGKVEVAVDVDPIMLNPNGVTAPEAGLLLVAEFFRGHVLAWRDGGFKVLATGLRGADAIERAEGGDIYVSSWTQGKVWRLKAGGGKPEVIIEGLKSAADFFLDRKENVLVLPDMLAGTVGFYRL